MPGRPAASCLCLPFNSSPSSESLFPFPSPATLPTVPTAPPGPAASGVLRSGDSAKGVGGARPSLCQPPVQVGEDSMAEGLSLGETKETIAGTICCPGPRCQELRSRQRRGEGRRQKGDGREKGSRGQPCSWGACWGKTGFSLGGGGSRSSIPLSSSPQRRGGVVCGARLALVGKSCFSGSAPSPRGPQPLHGGWTEV